jgi:putative ABC transport system permease protein
VPYSVYNAVLRLDDETEKDWICTVGIETDQHEQVADNLIELIQGNDKYSGYVNDYVSTMESMNTMVFILQVFVYGFITLITLITIANIINTISTGIALRRKEFAMLKSVGTTPKGFRKMISLESLLYGIKAVLIGIPISLLLSVVMNKTLGDDSIPFEINWLLYLMVIVVVLLIVGFSMLYSVSKLKNDSIIETLKEDIS